MRDNEFEFIRRLVYEHSRINLGPDKRELVSARLGKRLRACQLSTLEDYCDLLRADHEGNELAHLIDAISTNHTFFFREHAHFDFVRDRIVPELLARREPERAPHLRAWSAACSSGEEPYSLAITLQQALAAARWGWRIEATDISHRILAKARAGIYRADVVEKLPPATLKACFQRGIGAQDGNYRVHPALAAGVSFQRLNLLEGDPPFAQPFHLIFCRNVMIYFDRPTQEELVQKLTRWLVPGGHLLVGHSESLTGIRHGLEGVKPAVYRRPATP
jgi:chemotaxis protein methyltransferase CheR